MDFYISWSHSDARFSDYFEYCPTLVSAVNRNKNVFKKLTNYPSKLIIDSGAVYYSRKGRNKLKEIFEMQLSLIESMPETTPIKIVHLDEPLLNRNTLSERYESVERTLFNALEHMNLFERNGLDKNVSLMGVIQGFDFPSIKYSIHELKKMGYKHFGLGSMLDKSPKEQIEYITYVSNIVGPENLHIFGVTGLEQIKEMASLGVESFDSSRPSMAAVYFQIMYSEPFRTYLISSTRVNKTQEKIDKPLSCDCPICIVNPDEIINTTHRSFTKKRSIHNYYHLVKEIEKIKSSVEIC
ncbi:tRNA-guanine transglycosylase [Halobacillus sp. GSS1]|uniref:tRNA-guanine transglycosylase n=1 Tax=Halobacillus sp. GSS1 TaxID=2815919 RepID=UPI001A8E43B4|nr:tRNA-guanine transglycosylase [Halobacillus sp. GSS1]MBN9653290.1 tRNA-guanine transglycosylase [Halobacillus sp. GSS1]